MARIQIERGHDGPARRGQAILGETKIPTPALMNGSDDSLFSITYATHERTEVGENQPLIVALPSILLGSKKYENLGTFRGSMILPSIPSADKLGSSMGSLLLRSQLEIATEVTQHLDPFQLIIRIPHNINDDELQAVLSKFKVMGVRSAALSFDGFLGPHDLQSLGLRSKLPCNWLTLALGRIEPAMVPLLYYFGFDLLDAGFARGAAALGTRLWPTDLEHIDASEQSRYCSCSACKGREDFVDLARGDLYDILTRHNIEVYREILSQCQQYARTGKLRWFVESTTHTSPSMAGILRRANKDFYDFIEEFTPTTGKGTIPLIGPESYDSPVVKRFRDRLVERYSPPKHKRVVLILPCSARKPYSDSKSHKSFIRTIESTLRKARSLLAETIATSPLGVIPRELERVFPIANYDIPVTGEWDAEETSIGVAALVRHLEKFDKDVVIVAHVEGGYLDIVKNAESQIRQTIIYTISEGSATGRISLDSLSETLSDLKEILEFKAVKRSELEDTVKATADFQFGKGAGDLLVPVETKLGGKLYQMVTCRVDGEQVCSFIAANGILSLTLSGGRRLQSLGRYWVRFEGTEVKGGSIFAVGIHEADHEIRPGDEVIVVNSDDEVVAVGRSEMSGREMCEFERGRAVSVRHKAR